MRLLKRQITLQQKQVGCCGTPGPPLGSPEGCVQEVGEGRGGEGRRRAGAGVLDVLSTSLIGKLPGPKDGTGIVPVWGAF